MALGSGLAAQLMMAEESAYGTPVTVIRALEFRKETIKPDLLKVDSQAVGRGMMLRTDRTKSVKRGWGGDIEQEILSKGFGLVLKHLLGSHAVTGANADKTHTVKLAATGTQGLSMTVQVGRPGTTGTVRAHTYEGGKVTKWEFGVDLDGQLILVTSWDFENELTNTALASPSYASGAEPFTFKEATVTYGGSPFYTKNFKLSGDPKLGVDRRFLGNAKKEPLHTGMFDLQGALEGEYEDLTYYNTHLAGTTGALVIALAGPSNIPTASNPPSITFTLPAVEFLEAAPNVEGPDVLKLPLPFRVLSNGNDEPITITYVTADTAA